MQASFFQMFMATKKNNYLFSSAPKKAVAASSSSGSDSSDDSSSSDDSEAPAKKAVNKQAQQGYDTNSDFSDWPSSSDEDSDDDIGEGGFLFDFIKSGSLLYFSFIIFTFNQSGLKSNKIFKSVPSKYFK